jgi:hypothetical protein
MRGGGERGGGMRGGGKFGQGFNDRTFLLGRNPCRGCSKRAQSPKASSPSNTSERLKAKSTG